MFWGQIDVIPANFFFTHPMDSVIRWSLGRGQAGVGQPGDRMCASEASYLTLPNTFRVFLGPPKATFGIFGGGQFWGFPTGGWLLQSPSGPLRGQKYFLKDQRSIQKPPESALEKIKVAVPREKLCLQFPAWLQGGLWFPIGIE